MPALLRRAALLAALAAWPAVPAAAEDAAPAFAPADKNQDGVVSPREQRRYDRAQRRSRRGTKGITGGASDEDADAADADATKTRTDAAMAKAGAAASALKATLNSAGPGALPEGAEGPGGAAPARAGAAAAGGVSAGATGDPANPRSPSDFALAARSGYAPAFAAAGLKLSADGRTVVRADGSPATAEDLSRLRAAILSMPAALARRPDFFARLTPERFAELKRGYRENPRLSGTVYKDVGPTAGDRDLVHTESCAKVSGECNKSVEKASYRKGDFVAPEDLDRMWGALQKELERTDAEDAASGSPGRPAAAAGAASGAETFDGTAPRAGEAAPAAAAGGSAAGTPAAALASAAAATRTLWGKASVALGWGGADAPVSRRGLGLAALSAAAAAGLAFALKRRG